MSSYVAKAVMEKRRCSLNDAWDKFGEYTGSVSGSLIARLVHKDKLCMEKGSCIAIPDKIELSMTSSA